MMINGNDRSLVDEKMPSEEGVFIAPEGDPYNRIG